MLAFILRNIKINPKTGYYEAIEAGSKYQIHEDIIDSLKQFLRDYPTSLVGDWHRRLSEEDAKKVIKGSAYM